MQSNAIYMCIILHLYINCNFAAILSTSENFLKLSSVSRKLAKTSLRGVITCNILKSFRLTNPSFLQAFESFSIIFYSGTVVCP